MVFFGFEQEDSKPRRKSIPKAVKITVWNKYIGTDKAEGKCYVCKKTIHVTDFDCGHNKAVARNGNNNISNLRPICRTCNLSMRTTSIETFKARHFDKPKMSLKPALNALMISQLKALAVKHGITVKGSLVESIFDSHIEPPTKRQYVDKLAKVVTAREIKMVPKPVVKRKRRKTTTRDEGFSLW